MLTNRIVIIGTRAQKVSRLLIAILGNQRSLHSIEWCEYGDPELVRLKVDVAVFLRSNNDQNHLKGVRRFLRNLPYRQGLVVALGHDKVMRMASKGFSHTFRWVSSDVLWPGLSRYQLSKEMLLEVMAVARLAHEIGCSSSRIKEIFPSVLDYLT